MGSLTVPIEGRGSEFFAPLGHPTQKVCVIDDVMELPSSRSGVIRVEHDPDTSVSSDLRLPTIMVSRDRPLRC